MAKILILDDEPLNRKLLTTVLGYAGHDLVEAGDGGMSPFFRPPVTVRLDQL